MRVSANKSPFVKGGFRGNVNTDSRIKSLSNKALLASALSEKCSFTPSKLRFFILRAASK